MQNLVSSKQDAIEFYIDNGFILFPLEGKVPPAGCRWRSYTFNPFADFSANFGVQLQTTDFVIDVDPRNGGLESFQRLISKLDLPDTFTVTTGSGGKHYYFKKPADFKTRKNLKEYKGIDFISDGGYVVGAGSIHPETKKPYFGEPTEIAEVPQELLDLIEKQVIDLKAEGTKSYVDDEQTKNRYTAYLNQTPPAIEGESGDRTTFSVAATGRDYGLSPEVTFELMLSHFNDKCQPPWSEEALKSKVHNAYSYAGGTIGSQAPTIAFPKEKYELWTSEQDVYFHRSKSTNNILLNKHNTALMFAPTFPLEGLVAMDLFSHNIIFTRRAPWHKVDGIRIWNDEEATMCSHWLSTNKKYEPSRDLMHEGAVIASYEYQFHPVKEYFESLVWDGHKRVHNWMHNYLGAQDDQYVRAVGLKTLVACIKRIYEPGCKFDYITVLEGNQDTGKSTAWRILASKPWFGDTPIDISKEWSIMKTFGKIMYEWAEMETYRKSNTQAMKAFLSSDTDTVRLPYNRTVQAIPRQGIFVGTFNPEKDKDIGWLHDTTGNRRYWVVSTSVSGEIRNDKLEQARDQLWAEALVLYKAGTPIYFEDIKVIQQAQAEQAKRMGKDPWYDAIETWLNAPHNLDKMIFTGDEIFKDCIGGGLERYKRPEMSRISNVMVMLGWIKGVHHHPVRKESVSGYRRPSLE